MKLILPGELEIHKWEGQIASSRSLQTNREEGIILLYFYYYYFTIIIILL